MEKITRHVQELDSDEKRVYESVLGHKLRENQQVILHVITLAEQPEENGTTLQPSGTLPDYCNVYAGMSDEEIEELEKLILDRSPSRSTS